MDLSRREFSGGVLGLALGTHWVAPAAAQSQARLQPALDAIRAHANDHLREFGLPGLTLGLIAPQGFSTVFHLGSADAAAGRPITPDTLFQIGSISKVMTAAMIHQLAAEGRLRLTDPLGAHLPEISVRDGGGVTLQHLLDHTSGIPRMTPPGTPGGLWVGFAPGSRWHYSNSGYEILGNIAAKVAGQPLAQLLAERLFRPLGMTRSRGAIVSADRPLYAQGYEAADADVPWIPGTPLVHAPWVDVSFGAGSVASTADDMTRFMRSLAAAAQGRGGLGLSPEQASDLVRHSVPTDTAGTKYGNGLMHVAHSGRSYLHHTGGMLSFTSSFHLDPASGVAAFASSTLGSPEYRPRLLTRFAVDALLEGVAGRAPPAPPRLDVPLANAASYVGRYLGPGGEFEVRAGNPLTVVMGDVAAPLRAWGGEMFRTLHPQLRSFTLLFERKAGVVIGAAWGGHSFARQGPGGPLRPSDPDLARLAGRYVNEDPWHGSFVIVERGGKLWIGTETPIHRLGDNLWRVGEHSWSPERLSFADFVGERPQSLVYSGVKYRRRDS